MLRRTLNLGILAHVDAGKTTLTERLLYAAGVIDEPGSVDDGTTQTDSLALEQQRGITIRSAVVSFAIDNVTVNLIDTPGHPDFIAEVERVLSVLDGAVLVVSAAEGVQPQTRLLMRALRRLRIPTLLFVNKIDRAAAGYERVLEAISERLTPAIVAMGSVDGLGTRAARFRPFGAGDAALRTSLTEVLAEQDDSILAAYVEDEGISYRRLREELATQTGQALAHPVFFGSAITGAGVDSLMSGIAELLAATEGDADGPVSGTVFKIERGPAGNKIAYVRMFSGTVRTRDRLRFGPDAEEKVTAISVFDSGSAVPRAAVSAGEIGKLWGLGDIQIGDAVGRSLTATEHHHFAPPTLETVVVPRNADDKAALRVALAQLAEQDPLIDVRQDDVLQELSVSLYGEVQKEVIQATLANDFGLDVTFRETTTICIERPIGTGEAVEILHAESNPFLATVGLRIDPAPDGSGIDFRLQVDTRTIPLYVYKNIESFTENMGQYVRRTLQEGLFGWQVTDCIVTMTECTYSVPDGPPSRRGPLSTAADFRKLTPIVAMRALEQARTVVCEPIVRVSLEIPTDTIGVVMPASARLGAAVETPSLQGKLSTIEMVLPAARAYDLQRQLPRLTGGEGVLESGFAGYQPVSGDQPTRRRTTANPLNLDEYMTHLARRVQERSN
ncbi:MAG: TetM/TetW/TetO/TetS family tetracycline resistance ribosomal protection protein [Actinobacteria bacterium]|nr:TetM/TetW/TetO/TetS family tetracycline resistance ribosomal protection protein [Actinomycetota bacterium]